MNLVAFSLRTKGAHNFIRRLWTVFTRFGFSEAQTRRALRTILRTVQLYDAAPTFFIPAVVLRRHPGLIAALVGDGAEMGIHGYVHNDYRSLTDREQYRDTERAIAIFRQTQIPYHGFRNPYLGWTDASLSMFSAVGLEYDSNEAVVHDVLDLSRLSSLLCSGYEKSLALFQAIPCTEYTLHPHIEGDLLRIPTSIPDDEMLFDRLRMRADEIGQIWSQIMQRVYDRGGVYALNLHPERAVVCARSLLALLSYAASRPLPVWIACLREIAEWWRARSEFRLEIAPIEPGRWCVEVCGAEPATVLVRHLVVEDQPTSVWADPDRRVAGRRFMVRAPVCPAIALSAQTPGDVARFLWEQGYPVVRSSIEDGDRYALYLHLPHGLHRTRDARLQQCSDLVRAVETLERPLVRFGCWPDGARAALAITGDIDSVTVQDFFLRIPEVTRPG
jgi:peptidoglycan/xylan/chitin deacetylase (PgdA/CDA1 family)